MEVIKTLTRTLEEIVASHNSSSLAARHRHGHVAVAETSVRVCVLSQP